ncbi:MAG: DUF2786 domain-containing protein [Oleispira sp.]|nr:DUF2786 domain-containing protein [Oleispira sp.]MBL4881186.1 DUF2786 domain-containing protein [Oleispira sp.]
MSKKVEKAIDKIKKCLALAASSNANEAATAMRQAQALMAMHNLNTDDIQLSDVKAKTAKAGAAQTPVRYVSYLAMVIKKAFGVDAIFIQHFKGMNIEFIGIDKQAEIAAYAFTTLFRQLKADRSAYMKTLSRYKRANKIRKSDVFAEGWLAAVNKKVIAFAQPEPSKELIKLYQAKAHPKTETTNARAPKEKKDDGLARHKGFMQGGKATLNHGVGATHREMIGVQI